MSTQISQRIQSMIDSNRGMNFTYVHSNPEITRFAYPILIVGNKVIAIENGNYKRFKLDGIRFNDSRELNTVEQQVLSHIESKTNLVFTYEKSRPDYVRSVIPEKIELGYMHARDNDTGSHKSFIVSHIKPIIIKKEEHESNYDGALNFLMIPEFN